MTQIRMSVSHAVYLDWKEKALALHISVAEYAKLRALGVLVGEPTAEVVKKPAARDERQLSLPVLGPRIMAEMGRLGWERISTPHGVTKLAQRLGVDRRQMHGALGSLVAKKQLRRSVFGYHPIVAEDQPQNVIDAG
jgi:hypothetical protein